MSSGRQYFVRPETVRLELFDGDAWIEVKRRLTYGEENRLYGSGLGKTTARQGDSDTAELGIDFARFQVERLAVWLTDWSFRDEQDKPVKITRQAIENLAPEVVEAIDVVLTPHVEAGEAAKKATSGGSTSARA